MCFSPGDTGDDGSAPIVLLLETHGTRDTCHCPHNQAFGSDKMATGITIRLEDAYRMEGLEQTDLDAC